MNKEPVRTNQTLTKTRVVGPDMNRREMEFLFIEGMTVVGTIVADCVSCAWREGSHKWPNSLVAIFCAPVNSDDGCYIKKGKDSKRFSHSDSLRQLVNEPHRKN